MQFPVLVGAATFALGACRTSTRSATGTSTVVVLRFIQGFSVGARVGRRGADGRRHSPNDRRGFWASWPQAGVPVGNMLATIVLLVLTVPLSDAAFLSWGWRVAFWLSAVGVLIGYYIRTKVTDAPIFLEAQQEAEKIAESSYSGIEVLKRYPRGVFTAMGMRFGENIMYYLVVTFSITYLKVQVGADTSDILWYLLVAHAVHFLPSRCSPALDTFAAGRCTSTEPAGASWGFSLTEMNSANFVVVTDSVTIGLSSRLMYAPQRRSFRDVPHPDALFRCVLAIRHPIVAGSLAPIIA